jgi:hypothetical protein
MLAEANHHLVVGTNALIIGLVLTAMSVGELWLYSRTPAGKRSGVWTGYRRGWLIIRVVSPWSVSSVSW